MSEDTRGKSNHEGEELQEKLGFISRLRKFCGTSNTAEIARKLDIPYNTMKNYTDGRLPNAELLIHIRNHTGINLNWLLTGEEEPGLSSAILRSQQLNLATPDGLPSSMFIEIPATRLRIKLIGEESVVCQSGVSGEVPLYRAETSEETEINNRSEAGNTVVVTNTTKVQRVKQSE